MELDGYKLTPASPSERKKFNATYGTRVKISRNTYKLVCVKSINDGYVCGLCDFKNKTIYIALDADDIQATIIHEIMHGEIESSGLRQSPGFSRDFEEIVCELAAHAVGTNYVLRKR